MNRNLLITIIAFIATMMSPFAHAQLSNEAAGTYNGTLTVSQDGTVMGDPSKENVYLIASDDTHVTLEIRNFSFKLGNTSLPLGDIIIPGVELKKEENSTITLLPIDVKLTLEIVGEVTVHLKTSTIIDKKIVLALSVETIFPVELLIDVDFEGTQINTGISNTLLNKPTVFYNSATDAITIKGAENQKYTVYNVAGMHAMSGIVTTNDVSVSNLPKGLYLIKVGNNTAKFIK